MGGAAAAPVFVSSDSDFLSEGNYINVEELNVARCLNNRDASVFFETSINDECFSNTGTGTCNGECKGGFTEAGECMIGNPASPAYELTPQSAPGGSQGNPSCPASPPTPVPTLPPAVAGGIPAAPTGDGSDTPQPQSGFGTIPPGNPGAGTPAGSSPGSSPGGSDSGNGGQVFNAGNGGSSGATSSTQYQWLQILKVCSGLLLTACQHQLL